jgi:hypothetical protein
MANETVYSFSEQGCRRIAAAVAVVEGNKPRAGNGWHKFRGGGGASIIIGKTTAAWTKGTSATVAVWAGDPLADTGNTTTAMNLFADVESGKWVAMLGGYLISAEC